MALRKLKIKVKEKEGKITTAGRRALSASDFALGPREEEKRRGIKGRFPIHDIAHARNALARGAQALKRGTITAAEYATIKRKVKARYPQIEVEGSSHNPGTKKKDFKALTTKQLAGSSKFRKVMREFGQGRLTSRGRVVRDYNQALAIAFSEARRAKKG